MTTISPALQTELDAGVSLARLAQLLELSASTLKNYEKDGLLNAQTGAGKKLFGLEAFEAGQQIKRLRAAGLGLKEIAEQLGNQASATPSTDATDTSNPNAEELKARIELLREQLRTEKAKLEALAVRVGKQQRHNELVLTQRELEAIQELRESNVRRAIEVTRRAKVLKAQIQYKANRFGVVRLDTPQTPRKKR